VRKGRRRDAPGLPRAGGHGRGHARTRDTAGQSPDATAARPDPAPDRIDLAIWAVANHEAVIRRKIAEEQDRLIAEAFAKAMLP
jgi:hypothetical protein